MALALPRSRTARACPNLGFTAVYNLTGLSLAAIGMLLPGDRRRPSIAARRWHARQFSAPSATAWRPTRRAPPSDVDLMHSNGSAPPMSRSMPAPG